MTQMEKLEKIKNYATRYELALVNKDNPADKKLVVYMPNRSFVRLVGAISDRLELVKSAAGAAEVWVDHRQVIAGNYIVKFTGRTQREAIIEGELPFIGAEKH